MASSSSSSNPLLGVQVTEKLTRQNHEMWYAQVLAILRGARLERYVNGKDVAPSEEIDEKKGDVNDDTPVKVSNPAYEEWFATDQQVLGFLLTSLSKDILVQVATVRTSAEAWKTITDMFASHTRARTTNVRLALATTKKDNMTVAQYYGKMKGLTDEMDAAGKPLDNEELVMYIYNGLDTEYNSLVSTLVTRLEPIAPSELYSQLSSFETRLELQLGFGSLPSANSAGRGDRGGGQQRGGFNRGLNRGRGGRFNSGRGSSGRGRGQQQPPRQNQQRRIFPTGPTATHDNNG
jgi:hypothetical protein